MGEFVTVETADGIGTVRLNRPPMNPLSMQVQEEMRAVMAEVAVDPAVRAVVIWGGEKVFAAGADINEFRTQTYQTMSVDAQRLTGAFDTIARLGKPTVAAITGYALGGGCELALACDWRVVADDAKLGHGCEPASCAYHPDTAP